MTAQVGILNKEVAVLASDSATTVMSRNNVKIFKSVKKIHKIAEHIPVAFMHYGNAEFAGLSWRKVFDLYSQNYGGGEKQTLMDYYYDLVAFIENNPNLVSYGSNYEYFTNWLRSQYLSIEKMAVRRNGVVNIDQFKSWIRGQIESLDRNNDYIVDQSNREAVQASVSERLRDISSINIIQYPDFLNDFFGEISKYFTLLFMKTILRERRTGLVVAGFGKDGISPSLIHVYVEGLFKNTIKKWKPKKYEIGRRFLEKDKDVAWVVPFAQSDGADLLMQGITNELKEYITNTIKEDDDTVLAFLRDHAVFNKLEKNQRLKITSDMSNYMSRKRGIFGRRLDNHVRKDYSGPVVSSVSYMGESDLCELARALVNLTSLKRFYSINQKETVGGETNVVLLSKDKGYLEVGNKGV